MNLFSQDLKRLELLEAAKCLDFAATREVAINIHRNHAFEPVASVIAPFLHRAGLRANLTYGDYDDSLSFGLDTKPALELVFIDLERYALTREGVLAFLKERLLALREKSAAPIALFLLGGEKLDSREIAAWLEGLDSRHIFSFSIEGEIAQLGALEADFGAAENSKNLNFYDPAKESITGSRLSGAAALKTAQILGLRILPSLLLPNLKAVVVDLDNTLYGGILGEDGVQNLILTKAHIALQKQLLALKSSGILLAVASKNEEIDARELFKTRKDFALRLEDFDALAINWQEKSKNIIQIAKTFNIGLDSLLFIDDNIAEIEAARGLGVKLLHAKSPKDSLLGLYLYPALTRLTKSREDALRAQDIAQNQARAALKTLSDREYFESLQITLAFTLDERKNTQRIYELLNKTNQFIANYTRPSLASVESWLKSSDICAVSIAMKDKLSDSGIIAVLIARKTNDTLETLDLAISCRALGRRLESAMILHALNLAAKKLEITQRTAILHYQKGERNAPFLEVLGAMGANLADSRALLELKTPNLGGVCVVENSPCGVENPAENCGDGDCFSAPNAAGWAAVAKDSAAGGGQQ